MIFKHPEPSKKTEKIVSVFIPFSGCKIRCVFCAQETQTGQIQTTISSVLREAEERLSILNKNAHPTVLAFYGGTFTALEESDFKHCLNFITQMRRAGLISCGRCSTRPDAITTQRLQEMKAAGITTVELGVQSFDEAALNISGRAYNRRTIVEACHALRKAGFAIGIQLMPGMPGVSPEIFAQDIQQTITQHPDFVRLYPCLVFRGTPLAKIWTEGRFAPWSMEEVLSNIPPALLQLWDANIAVIRMGLAPQDGLHENILAGPWHPALGQELRSHALFSYLKKRIQGEHKIYETSCCTYRLVAPKKYQGEFFGLSGSLKNSYAQLGILPENVRWTTADTFELTNNNPQKSFPATKKKDK